MLRLAALIAHSLALGSIVTMFTRSTAGAGCRQVCWTRTTFVPQICFRCYNIGRNRVCSQYQCGSRRVYAGQQCICS